MRPLKLTMNAFGPYKGKQLIDFTLINDKNLFLITGPTGAGKTTIFDGIAYALFGKASGSERDKDNFRSDFADDFDTTYVELEFELKGKVYKIFRSPKQLKPKVNGSGFTEKSAEATLVINSEKQISGPKKVDEEINDIFGINYDQFKQLVMLPQGEFRKLLNADSKEREDIFRKIFGTHLFKKIQEKLEETNRVLKNAIQNKRHEIDTYIKSINYQENDNLQGLLEKSNYNYPELLVALENDLVVTNEKYQIQTTKLDKKREQYKNLVLEFNFTKEINEKYMQLEQLNEDLKAHLQQEESMKQNNNLLMQAKLALKIKPFEDRYQDSQTNLNNAKTNFELVSSTIRETSDLEVIKRREKDALDSDKATIKELEKQVDNLNTKYNQYKEYQIVLQQLDKITNQISQLENAVKDLNYEYQQKVDSINQTINQVLPNGSTEETIIMIKDNITQTKYQNDNLNKILNKIDEIIILEKEHKEQAIKYQELLDLLKEKQISYERYEEVFRKEQAGILASNLTDGSPCPVCGSLNHPNKASIKRHDLSEANLNKLKTEYEKQNELTQLAYSNVQEVYNKINTNKNIIKEETKKHHDLVNDDIQTYRALIEEEINRNNQNKQKFLLMLKSIEEGKEDLERINSLIDKNKLSLQDLTIKHTSIKTKCDTYEQLEINKYKSLGEIESLVREDSLRIINLKNKIESTESEYQRIQLDLERLKGQLSENEVQIALLKEKLAGEKLTFNNLLKEQRISETSYIQAKINIGNINKYEEQIASYSNVKLQLETKIQSIESIVKGKVVGDLDVIQEKIDLVNHDIKEYDNHLKEIYSKIENNTKMFKAISKTHEKMAEENQKYNDVSTITEIALGKNNQRLTFERYVLAVYFEEIINASNVRLSKMTNDRYIMLRKDEKGKGAAQQGLDLEVFDNYTGKKRDIKTLSGGESFKASLSLALGLADIVQSYAGGINLDTIFIDEGFGSLDPESLESAIECLISLKDAGRLVGVISHVQELKERIDVKLEISTSNNGSSAQFIY